ncbi:MAG: DUF6583 family protein [Clostridia bacterium]
MNQKKSSKILMILIIIVLLIILIGGIVIVCLATDLFKSDKELFFKYITQIGDSENGFIDNNLKQYWEKQKTIPYINEGGFSTNITSEQGQQQFDNVNNFNINFSGQVDAANSKSAQDISLNYSDSVNFPISYKQVGNIIGLQTKYVGNKFIAIQTDKLSNLAGSTDVDLEDYTDIAEKLQAMSKIELTDDEKSNMQNTYMEVLNTNLNDNKFSKVEDSNMKGYKVSLTGEELKNVMVQLLQTLENDQTTLDKINEYLKTYKNSSKLTVNSIENTIKNINNNSNINNENFEITVYCQSGKTSKILIEMQDMKVTIQKESTKDTVNYAITIEEKGNENARIYFKAEYSGLAAIQSVAENYEIELQYEANPILEYARNSKSELQVQNEREKILLLITEINVDKVMDNTTTEITKEDIEAKKNADSSYSNMEIMQISDNEIQIKFTDTDDIFEVDKTGTIIKEPEVTENSNNSTTTSNGLITYKYQYNNTLNFTDSVNIEDFTSQNSMILTDYDTEKVDSFLNAVIERISQVNKQQMEELGLEENENPIIYMIPSFGIYSSSVAAINSTEMSELEINTFNNKFEMYESTNLQGVTVKGLLSTISLNNESQDNDRQIKEINFNGEEYEATDENLTFIKEDIDTEKSYRVEFEKDQDTGIIYRAVINEK